MALLRSAAFKDSNSSSSSQRCRYHVFLSFRGEDTRKTFTDHLYTALINAGFQTFRDNDELERGEDIKPELEKAIRQSQTSVIVFSKDYASSRWCLDELLIILERKRTNKEFVVLPVFYNVDPSQLRKQTGSFAQAFSRHQSTQSSSKVSRWRAALAQVADLAGMVLPNQADGYESKFIKKIVKVIEGKLRRVTPLSVSPKLIGIQSRAKRIDSWLKDGSTDVGILVLYGISGVGKTTIAKSVYNSNFRRFEGRSFVENIRELSEQPNGLVQIQKHLLSDILNGRNVEIHSVSEGVSKVEDAIRSKRVLLILDDVDHTNQLDAVFRMKHCFYPGSKIIITTRRAKLLKPQQVSDVHNVEPLSYDESMKLFSWHAFEQDHPVDGYMKHSEEVVNHCGGLPLALRVLGSSLMGESLTVWQSTIEKLKAIPDGQIMKKLRSSYDSLQDNHDRDLFLHIACFFVGKDEDCVVRILDECQFHTVVGIQNLIDRCLVTIHRCESHKYCKIQMHDLVRDMGREIVRLEYEEPEKRSRLWHHKDSFKVLREKNGTQTICGLVLNMFPADTTSMNSDEIVFETEAFARMHKLKLLRLSNVQLNGSYAEFPTELRWLCWHEFSLNSIPINFPLENLVVLEMQHSCLRQVWKGTKRLPSLKILDLSHSHDLESVADFSLFPNLEKLILVHCQNLIDVHESIESLEKLVYLNMKDCKSIRMLNKNIGKLKLLKTLIISGCSNLNESSVEMMRNMESLKVLEADEIPVNQVLTAGGQLIESWPARSSYIFWTSLPCSLVSLSLSGCDLSNEDFPMELGNLSSLEKLNLQSTSVCSLPSCIKGLKKLCELNFGGCKSLKELVGLPKVKHVFVTDCTSLEKVTYESFSSYKNSLVLFRHNRSLVEAEYTFRLEPIGKVDTEMINLLELRNYLESTATIKMHVPFSYGKISQDYESRPIQGLYEYGIFSTFLPGNQVPGRFSHRSSDAGTSISCRVPSLPPNYVIRGLNIFAVYALSEHSSFCVFDNPLFKKVWNKSKSLKWIYNPQVYGIPREGEDMVWLSHWKLEGELLGGNEVVVSVFMQPGAFHLKEFGVQLVCEKHENNITSTQHNTWTDPYYPCVIGGDLSSREATEGTYWLCWRAHSPEAIAWFDYLDRDFDDHELNAVTQLGEEEEEEEDEEEEEAVEVEEEQLQDDPMLLPAATGRLPSDPEDENNGSKNDIEISESSKKGSQGNDNDVQSAAKDVIDEELMQCLEILNNMEELDDDTYSKALKLFHDDATWRKLFVSMPDKRKKPFILGLGSCKDSAATRAGGRNNSFGGLRGWNVFMLASAAFFLFALYLLALSYERRRV